MTTRAVLAKRLRLARLNLGLTQETVASELKVPRPTISQIEAGRRSVSSLELSQLAKLYRRPLGSFFEEQFEENLGEDPLTVFFRATELRAEDRSVVEEFVGFCRAYVELEALLELRSEPGLPDYSAIGEPRNQREAVRQGELVAAEERRRLGIGDDPIRDVFDLLESQGVRLLVRPLRDTGISGLFLFDRSLGPCILIKGADDRNRLLFNAAHEYAHVLLDRKLRAHTSAAGRLLDEPDQPGELLEVRANSFAAAFLLPADGIERFLGNRGKLRRHPIDVLDVLYLDRSFGVGYQATLYRLQNLGWIGREQHVQLAHHRPEVLGHALGVADEGARDEGPTAAGRYPPRYVYLALEAYRQAKVSLGKLAELLGQSPEDVRDLVWNLGISPEAKPALERT